MPRRTGPIAPLRVAFLLLCCSHVAHAAEPVPIASQASASSPPAALPSEAQLRALLRERLAANGVGIVIGLIDTDGTRTVVAEGRSGAADARPLDGDTVFLIGSVTKVFTSLLLADMVERGEVALDDPAAKHLPPGVTMPEHGRPITLLDLSTHVSGLPSMPTNFDLQAQPDPYAAYATQQLYAFLSGYTPERAPGERAVYSNLGVSLLAQLLANRARMPYGRLLRERVLAPLGMHDTAIEPTPDQARRLARGHDRYLQPVQTWEMVAMPGSGSLRSTVNDLLRFLAAYLDAEGPLHAAMARQLSVRAPTNRAQALGWALSRIGDVEVFGHRGGKEGYRSAIAFDPTRRRGVVVLANARTDDEPGDLAMHLLAGRALAPPPRAPRRPETTATSSRVLAPYAGRYRRSTGMVLTVASRGDMLAVETAPGSGISTFLPAGTHHFYLNTGNDELSFEVDPHGCVRALVLHGDGLAGERHERALRLDPARNTLQVAPCNAGR